MFNNYSNSSSNINVSNGIISKTHPKSWFKKFHLNSTNSSVLLSGNKCYYSEHHDSYRDSKQKYGGKEVLVLQIMLCGSGEVLSEIVYKEDYEKEEN